MNSKLLPSFEAPATHRVWLVAAHGGAGCSTIYSSAKDRYADAGRALPVSSQVDAPSHIVLCAQGTSRGLESLQDLLREWRSGLFGSTELVGIAVTSPRVRTPHVLVRSRKLVCSVIPKQHVFVLPFITNLDVDGIPETYPHRYARMSKTILSLDPIPRPVYRSEKEQ